MTQKQQKQKKKNTNENKCFWDGTPMQKAQVKIRYHDGIQIRSEGYRCPKCGDVWLTVPQAHKFEKLYNAAKKAQQTRTITAKTR
nr:hypothetical protein [Candidatus Freyarchaeota archaeon]